MFPIEKCPVCSKRAVVAVKDCHYVVVGDLKILGLNRDRKKLTVPQGARLYVVHDECLSAFRKSVAMGAYKG